MTTEQTKTDPIAESRRKATEALNIRAKNLEAEAKNDEKRTLVDDESENSQVYTHRFEQGGFSYGSVCGALVDLRDWDLNSSEYKAHEELSERANEDPKRLLKQGRILLPMSTRDINVTNDNSAGNLVPAAERGEIIDLIRDRMILSDAGVREIPMPAGGMFFPKLKNDVTAYWADEAEQLTKSDLSTGSLHLQPKKLTAYVILSNEALSDTNPGFEQIVRDSFAESIARAKERAYFLGLGSDKQPMGLLNDPNTVKNGTGYDLGTDGGTPTLETLMNMMEDFESRNGDLSRAVFVTNPRTVYSLLRQREKVYDGTTTEEGGAYLFQPDLLNPAVFRFRGIPILTTNNIPVNLTKGTSTDTTFLALGQFEHSVIANTAALEVSVSTDFLFDTDQTVFKAISRLDMGALRPEFFIIATGVRR